MARVAGGKDEFAHAVQVFLSGHMRENAHVGPTHVRQAWMLGLVGFGLAGVCIPMMLAGQGAPHGACVRVADSSHASVAARLPADIGVISGRRIGWVSVVTLPPEPLPGAAVALDHLHVRTRSSTIRRELLFAAGDTVDSLSVSESLRRLRRLRYLADVQLAISQAETSKQTAGYTSECSGRATLARMVSSPGTVPPVGLTITTRDAWSARPNLRVGSGTVGSVVGFEELNVMGTGRAAKAYLRADNGSVGVGVAYVDPWLAGRDVIGRVSRDVFKDGGAWRMSVGTHQRSIFDPWVVELALSQSARSAYAGSHAATGDTVRRRSAIILFDRLLTVSPFGATRLLFGMEGEQTREVALPTAPVLGPLDVHRSFAGVDVGMARHTARYGSNDWLLPRSVGGVVRLVDVPQGTEGEAIVAVGRDFLTMRPAVHLDAWSGRIWSPGQHSLVTADVWASGFRTGPEWSAASVRGAIGAYRAATRGLWRARLAAEELTDPDPTVRALSTFDPTIPSLPPRSRLAEAALAGSLERTLHLRPITHSYMLDAAAFGAGSFRWDPAASVRDRFGVATVGVGLRLSPLRQGIATLRLDAGFPVTHTAGLPSRPFIAVSISPWLGAGRQRDGRGGH
ncbi:MAG: hypothetical protein ABI026_01600 [Gemmatimonadaceae bacterium]